MACRYFFEGQEYNATQLRDKLKKLPPERLMKYVPAAAAAVKNPPVSTPDRFLKNVFREIEGITDEQAAGLTKIMQERPQDLGDALIEAMNPKKFDKFLEYWKAGLVSAPGTQVANVLGNAGEQIMRLGETATQAVVDRMLGGTRQRVSGEARFELAGGMKGAGKALGRLGRDIVDIAKLSPEKIDMDKLDFGPKIGGKTGRAVRIPFRLLTAFDDFFKSVGGEAELHKLAFREAGGDAAKAAAIIANPSKAMLAKVQVSRLERSFQDPNELANSIMRFRSQHKWAHIIMPFVQTPANIASVAWQRSPGGFYEGYKALQKWKQATAKGVTGDELDALRSDAVDKLARPLFGTLLLATFYANAKAGGMTGSGPTDQREKSLLQDTGWQPYSFVIPVDGGRKLYVPFARLEPASTILGIAADLAEAKDAKSGEELANKGIGSITENFLKKSYLRGLGEASQAAADPSSYMGKYVSNLAGSLVPNVVAKSAQAIDPAIRDTRPESSGITGIPERIAKTWASRIPGASLSLAERKGGTGEAIERQGNAATRFLFPQQITATKAGRELESELVSIGYVPSQPKREITLPASGNTPSVKVRLSDEEYAYLQDAHQKASEYIRKNLLKDPKFKRLPGTLEEGGRRSRESEIRRIYDRFSDNARARLKAIPSFRAKVQKARSGRPQNA
jgi:hypothetical protein